MFYTFKKLVYYYTKIKKKKKKVSTFKFQAAQLRVELKITCAKDLENVNWRGGRHLQPYFRASVDGGNWQSTYVAEDAGAGVYSWDRQILYIPITTYSEGDLHIECLHQLTDGDDEQTDPSVGTTQINLSTLASEVGTEGTWFCWPVMPGSDELYPQYREGPPSIRDDPRYLYRLQPLPPNVLKRSSGRPQGVFSLRVRIRRLGAYEAPDV